MYIYISMQKDPVRPLKILQFMSEFGGLWKQQQKNSACTKSVRVFVMLKLDTIRMKKNCCHFEKGPYPENCISKTSLF